MFSVLAQLLSISHIAERIAIQFDLRNTTSDFGLPLNSQLLAFWIHISYYLVETRSLLPWQVYLDHSHYHVLAPVNPNCVAV